MQKILSNCQYGFQKNKSTYMPLILLQENIIKTFEKGNMDPKKPSIQ